MKRSRSVALLGVVLTVLVARTASAQSEKLSGRFPATIEGSLRALIDSAGQTGLPTEPLVQRALEGASRGVEPERVVNAVRALATRLASARQALGPVSEPELVAAASALYLGVSPERLGQLRRSTEQSLALPLVVLTDLVGQGGLGFDRIGVADRSRCRRQR